MALSLNRVNINNSNRFIHKRVTQNQKKEAAQMERERCKARLQKKQIERKQRTGYSSKIMSTMVEMYWLFFSYNNSNQPIYPQ